MGRWEFNMPNKMFLEEYPLYRKMEVDISPPYRHQFGVGGTTLSQLPRPAVNRQCIVCKSIQTFNMGNSYYGQNGLTAHDSPIGNTFRLEYRCASCNQNVIIFFVEVGETEVKVAKDKDKTKYWIRKVGQNPPWEIVMDGKLGSVLGSFAEMYRKGLTCESQGYGIGAYSYYRRIVEEIIDTLLDSITELIETTESKEKYTEALRGAKNKKNAEDKIQIVKDLLPPSLRPDKINPLNIIYSALSEGLHAKTDEECLELADSIRKSLVFLVNQLLTQKESKKEFTESMKKLLEKKDIKLNENTLTG